MANATSLDFDPYESGARVWVSVLHNSRKARSGARLEHDESLACGLPYDLGTNTCLRGQHARR